MEIPHSYVGLFERHLWRTAIHWQYTKKYQTMRVLVLILRSWFSAILSHFRKQFYSETWLGDISSTGKFSVCISAVIWEVYSLNSGLLSKLRFYSFLNLVSIVELQKIQEKAKFYSQCIIHWTVKLSVGNYFWTCTSCLHLIFLRGNLEKTQFFK